ncbi:hypothetical protein EIP86_000526 [Pleurotus ostreatoroseus]|nr:hypothetical protein EIP86_000526 [Pleurotus ostreatoroseus]
MGTLRRDITSQWMSRILQQSALVEVSSLTALTGDAEHKLSIVLCPTSPDDLTARISNLSTVLTFLNQYLFPHLPSSAGFPSCLSKPATSAVLNELLIPSLPSDVSDLPAFLELMTRSVKFEQEYIGGMLGDANRDTDIKRWADAVAAHYERKRRADILEETRRLIVRPEDDSTSFRAILSSAHPPESPKNEPPRPPERVASPEDVAWGLDEEGEDTTVDEEGWGLEDVEESRPQSTSQAETAAEPGQEVEEDDPWALNDGDEQPASTNGGGGSEEGSSDSFAWDDPWEDEAPSISSPSKPKTASRLEKLSHKGKSLKDAPPIQSPIPIAPPPPTPAMTSFMQSKPVATQPRAEQESYLVSGRAKELVALLEHVLQEAAELAASPVLAPYAAASSSAIGSTLYQGSTQMLDLYRALYPVAASAVLSGSTKRSACFSNDCLWISEQIVRMASHTLLPTSTGNRLRECGEIFKLLSDSWFDDALRMQEGKVLDTLDQAQGFIGTTDQDRFDECENAVNSVLQDIRRAAQQCKPVLPKSKYYRAIGIFANAALGRILSDILTLSDITAQESHKLSELCRILNALEGLFVEDPDQPSFVVAYVPLWLKFSYLSELLEASIADISYLFEEGALVDFEIDELINLVRALFSDTPLRTNTINKLMRGHPPIVS